MPPLDRAPAHVTAASAAASRTAHAQRNNDLIHALCVCRRVSVMWRQQVRFDFDSTAVRRPSTAYQRSLGSQLRNTLAGSRADLFLFRPQCSSPQKAYGRNVGRRMVVRAVELQWSGSRSAVNSQSLEKRIEIEPKLKRNDTIRLQLDRATTIREPKTYDKTWHGFYCPSVTLLDCG